jgi:hypothetical protein
VIVYSLDDNFVDIKVLKDMTAKLGSDVLVYSWMRNRNTVEFLGIWEQIHNPNFKGLEFETFKKEAGLKRLSVVSLAGSLVSLNNNFQQHKTRPSCPTIQAILPPL